MIEGLLIGLVCVCDASWPVFMKKDRRAWYHDSESCHDCGLHLSCFHAFVSATAVPVTVTVVVDEAVAVTATVS